MTMAIGEHISNLILTNLEIWHRDYDIRKGKDIPPQQKAKTFLESRIFNARRTTIRYEIDNILGEAVQDFKVNYYKGDK